MLNNQATLGSLCNYRTKKVEPSRSYVTTIHSFCVAETFPKSVEAHFLLRPKGQTLTPGGNGPHGVNFVP
jgi:hypothetical protein